MLWTCFLSHHTERLTRVSLRPVWTSLPSCGPPGLLPLPAQPSQHSHKATRLCLQTPTYVPSSDTPGLTDDFTLETHQRLLSKNRCYRPLLCPRCPQPSRRLTQQRAVCRQRQRQRLTRQRAACRQRQRHSA